MRVAIIGAGNVGRALAEAVTRAGHHVTITSRDTTDARQVAEEVGAQVVESNPEAAGAGDVVLLAVPYTAVGDVLGELGHEVDGTIFVDVSNRMNPQDPAASLDGSSVAERLQVPYPQARIFKASNTVLAARQANPEVDGVRLDGYVAGDDAEGKALVLDLVRSIGLRPLDVGPLYMARVLEGMAALNILLNSSRGWPWQSGWKLLGPTGDAE